MVTGTRHCQDFFSTLKHLHFVEMKARSKDSRTAAGPKQGRSSTQLGHKREDTCRLVFPFDSSEYSFERRREKLSQGDWFVRRVT